MKRATEFFALLPTSLLCVGLFLALTGCTRKSEKPGHTVTIVAAENFYGSVAQEIAGDSTRIVSILTNPNQDPHEFTADAQTAKDVADADIVIYNGLGYDEWMKRLIDANANHGRIVLCVSDLIHAKAGANPHICSEPGTMGELAKTLSGILKRPEHLERFDSEMSVLDAKITEIKSKFAGASVTATEPVFEYMISALGLVNQNQAFQRAVMNGTEPGFQATADFEQILRSRSVKLLLYNSQVTSPASERMKSIAQQSGIPIVGVMETEPPEAKSYTGWMLKELKQIEEALNAHS